MIRQNVDLVKNSAWRKPRGNVTGTVICVNINFLLLRIVFFAGVYKTAMICVKIVTIFLELLLICKEYSISL